MTKPAQLLNLVHGDARFKAVLGSELGRGAGRTVFAHSRDPGLVVKVGKTAPYSSNLTEWLIWKQIEDEPQLAALFGRCTAISVSGRYLVMERLDDLTTDAQRDARRYPVWTTDHKADAFGVDAAGTVKIRDYGLVVLGQTLNAAAVLGMLPDAEMAKYLTLMDK